MLQQTISVRVKNGFHARVAATLVQIASSYPCCISVETVSGAQIDLKSILSIMSAGVCEGDDLILTTNGDMEDKAFDSIKNFLIEDNQQHC